MVIIDYFTVCLESVRCCFEQLRNLKSSIFVIDSWLPHNEHNQTFFSAISSVPWLSHNVLSSVLSPCLKAHFLQLIYFSFY